MAMPQSDKIWFNGELVNWEEAKFTSSPMPYTTVPASSKGFAATTPGRVRRCSAFRTISIDCSIRRESTGWRSPTRAKSCVRRFWKPFASTSSNSATFAPSYFVDADP